MKETIQIPKSPYFCWVKDHRWGHIVARTSVTLDRLHFVCYIFLLTTLRPHLWFITEQTHGKMESLYQSDIFSEDTFQFTVQASKFCKKEYAFSNSYLFLIKGVCYPLLCLFPTTEPLWQGTDWTHRWLDGCSFWLPWQIHSGDPPKLPAFSPKSKRYHGLYT